MDVIMDRDDPMQAVKKPANKKSRVKAEGKRKKDPNKPKRPTSAYFYFVAKQREELNKMGKKITRVAEWTKEVSVKWKSLSDKERVPFDKLAKTDKARYDSEMKKYKGKDENKPKRAMSAYFLWLADFRKENKDRDVSNKELLQLAGQEWKALSAEKKQPYEQKAEVGRKEYEVAMKEYNATGGSAAKSRKVGNGAAAAVEEDDEDDEEEEEEEDEDEDDDDE